MIKIWGRTDSSNVQKVLWCCDELGIAYERIDIGGKFGGTKEKPYLDLNPNGVVPTIEDGSFVLWESNSILRYLVEKYGGKRLLPSTTEGRANANRWMDWQLSTLNSLIVPVFVGIVRGGRDPATIEEARKKSAKAWEMVDGYLAKKPFLGGDGFSIGDMPLGIWAYRWFTLPIERPELKNLKAWYDRLCERGPYKTHVMLPLSYCSTSPTRRSCGGRGVSSLTP